MTSIDLKKLLLGTTLISGFAVMTAVPSFAQTDDTDAIVLTSDDSNTDDEDGDEIVVTGSRIKRANTFNSISPLQVIDTDIAAEQGLFNPVEILQSSSAGGGQQIDSTFQGFVLDNGPGSETIDLRGLGASRTLVLINGRRMAPSGQEGVPSQPSINTIPRTMVDRFDLLTDGASSVYGSDAVAGVINVVMKNDFDGLEVEAFADAPEQGGGEDYTLGASWGKTGDKGFIGVGAEYRYEDPWTTGDRDFLSGCETFLEETESGLLRTDDIRNVADIEAQGLQARTSGCVPSRNTQRILINYPRTVGGFARFGSLYYIPGVSSSGIGEYNFLSNIGVFPDANSDGVVDSIAADFSPNGQQADVQQLQNEQKQISLMATGEITLDGSMNVTPYFEALHVNLETNSTGRQGQLFPFVPSNNPFNPCNPDAVGGVDCGLAHDAALLDPTFVAQFQNVYGTAPTSFPFIFSGPLGPLEVRPVVGIRGDRNNVKTDLGQTRLVGGIKGDLPFVNFGSIKDWEFDISALHSWSDGTAVRSGIRADRLNYSLGRNPLTGADLDAPCAPVPGLDADVAAGCVPVNLFAPSLMGVAAAGEFATAAERNYIFDERIINTHVSQTIGEAIIQGDLFTLPGGDVSMLLGAQIREDKINSDPNPIARDGLFFGFFNDGGGVGAKTTKEAYGEISFPLGTGKPFWREFNVDLAGRLTDDEFYGTNETYSIKAGYRPIDSLLLRGTVGTSFRAPNLRENFLAGQSGFGNIGDPCLVPSIALSGSLDNPDGGYNRQDDPRDQITLDNCRAQGVDPESFGEGGFGSYSVEIEGGGTFDLEPERSDSYTLGFSFQQPFTDAVDLEFGATYYDIDIKDTVIEPSAGFIVNDCLVENAGLTSAFCSRITRNFNDPALPGRISLVDNGFINRNNETARGIDFAADLGKTDVAAGSKTIDFGVSARVNRLLERKTVDLLDGQEPDIEEFKGDFGFSKWRGSVTGRAAVDKFRLAWTTRFQTKVEIDEDERGAPDFQNIDSPDSFVVTCAGPDAGDENCRTIWSADTYVLHNASVAYREDSWSLLVGVNNVFDKKPALVDGSEVFSVNNVPLGNGYDLNGREFFVQARKSFR